ncbi:DUF423 domain-containing protein [Aurantimonas sp. A2-1-M11]|uniref:DUF423 domain-containing protein n=1 Tax=Aurantimonas sp. A2-1-M11 TaxID=3113712 RepID=UPI002F91CB69
MLTGILVVFAGLFGAAGIAGAAVAAHGGGDAQLAAIAAAIAVVHAPTLLALAGLRSYLPRLAGSAGFLAIIGTLCFSGDLAARVAWDDRLFTNAAPIGGSLLILSWMVVAVAGIILAVRRTGFKATP